MIFRVFFLALLTVAAMLSAFSGSASAQQVPFQLMELQRNFPVTLYTSPNCTETCAQARELLNRRGVPFKESQVWNEETVAALKKLSGAENLPTLVVGRHTENGFEPTRYGELLDAAGYPPAGTFPVRSQAAPAAPEGWISPDGSVTKPAAAPVKPGPYDTGGLAGPAPKPGIYDPSTLPAGPAPKPGGYDPSGLPAGPAPKPGGYDPSGLTGPEPRPGRYRVPGDNK